MLISYLIPIAKVAKGFVGFANQNKALSLVFPNVAGRLPKPQKNKLKLGVQFFETQYTYDDKMTTNFFFHHCSSDLTAGVHGQFGTSRLDWP